MRSILFLCKEIQWFLCLRKLRFLSWCVKCRMFQMAVNENIVGDKFDRISLLYPSVNEEITPLPRSWSPKDKYNYIGLSQNNLRVHYKGMLRYMCIFLSPYVPDYFTAFIFNSSYYIYFAGVLNRKCLVLFIVVWRR